MNCRSTLSCLCLAFALLFLPEKTQAQGFVSGLVSCVPAANILVTAETPGDTLQWVTATDDSGFYSLFVPVNGRVTITPSYTGNPLNGVSTYDAVLIAAHIADGQTLNTPYKLIAADVDDNGAIDLQDTAELKKLILGIYTDLPNGSTRFVPANYVFPNPANPFDPPFPRTIVLDSLTGNRSGLNFYGIRIGDVNVDPPCNTPPFLWSILGDVVYDQNGNCSADSAEPFLGQWLISARNLQTGQVYQSLSAHHGPYAVSVPAGDYAVTITPPNGLFTVCTDSVVAVQVTDTNQVFLHTLAQADTLCAFPEVSIGAPFLRRCFPNTYTVHYRNTGTATLPDAEVRVAFDSFFSITGSTLPWTTVAGNTYTFPIGSLLPAEEGHFKVFFELSCNATLGQTHCSTAEIAPYTPCSFDTAWDGSQLQVQAFCDSGNVVFVITNLGEDMSAPVDYVVVEDIMIQMIGAGEIQLNSGETQIITLPANGSTWRIEVGQTAGNPYGTGAFAGVEGCGTDSAGAFSLGIVNLFPVNTGPQWQYTHCLENGGAYDPNDKQGYPLGVGEPHWIPREQRMEYQIRFQNTGTDTAFTVMIIDRLDERFDLSSIRPGASSHPYRFELLDDRRMQFIFPNIMLPDSNVNEPASHGFVRFSAAPVPGAPNGTAVENSAAIYFDFNDPVITNTTLHTFGEAYLQVATRTPEPGRLEVRIWPNPAVDAAQVLLRTSRTERGIFQLFDAGGRQVLEQAFDQNLFRVNVRDLAPGVYHFMLKNGSGRVLGGGKVLVAR